MDAYFLRFSFRGDALTRRINRDPVCFRPARAGPLARFLTPLKYLKNKLPEILTAERRRTTGHTAAGLFFTH